jgi:hypothetical protein
VISDSAPVLPTGFTIVISYIAPVLPTATHNSP